MLDYWAITAGIFVAISTALTLHRVILHLCNFTKPYLQRYIIRILMMVPIYSLNAWVAMVVPGAGIYLDASREVYESYVIYSFMRYLLNFLHTDTNLQQYIDHKPGPKNLFPLCFLYNCIGGRTFMARCKHGIFQYVVVRPITTLIAFISQMFDFYGEGNYNPFSGYTYPILLLVNNVSQIIAMYCLVIFYTGYKEELRPMKPLPKFFSIKLVVFFSFFQSVLISGLLEIPFIEQIAHGLFPDIDNKIEIARKLQEFLICFDMLIAAIGHQYAFSHRPYTEDDMNSFIVSDSLSSSVRYRESTDSYDNPGCCAALCNIFDFSDDKNDLNEHFNGIFGRVRGTFKRRQPLNVMTGSSSHLVGNRLVSPAANRGDTGSRASLTRNNAAPENYRTIE